MYYFNSFPTVEYDLEKNGKKATVTDISLRFKIISALKDAVVVYYDYMIGENERPDIIAHKYYGDATLDWLIFLANDIVDPQYDWPLSYDELNKFVRSKYGSISNAQGQIHHYEWIVRQQGVLYDGTVQEEYSVEVDENTYNSLTPANRRVVYAYEYEIEKNEKKRRIRLIDKEFLQKITSAVESVFEE